MVWSSLSGAIVSMGQRDSDHGFKENYGNFRNLKLKGEKGEEKKKESMQYRLLSGHMS